MAVRRAHARWSRSRGRNFRSGSANSIVVRRAHARWSRLTEEIFAQVLRASGQLSVPTPGPSRRCPPPPPIADRTRNPDRARRPHASATLTPPQRPSALPARDAAQRCRPCAPPLRAIQPRRASPLRASLLRAHPAPVRCPVRRPPEVAQSTSQARASPAGHCARSSRPPSQATRVPPQPVK